MVDKSYTILECYIFQVLEATYVLILMVESGILNKSCNIYHLCIIIVQLDNIILHEIIFDIFVELNMFFRGLYKEFFNKRTKQ